MVKSLSFLRLALLVVLLTAANGMSFHSWQQFSENTTTSSTSSSTAYDAAKLNIHILAHTHDDMGWLKTVDQYYYGDRNDIQRAGVRYILDSAVRALDANSERRFVYVEMGFFKRWWDEQDERVRTIVHRLVKTGQLEFANAGWTMNDESDVYYEDILTNMMLGHAFLLKEFGIKPTVGWHIDPFGHQSAQASIFAQMGFDAFFFSRLDYQDRAKRVADGTMEMVWRPKTAFGSRAQILTSVMYEGYCPPLGFCFDDKCQDPPMMVDRNLKGFNGDRRASTFVEMAKKHAEAYPTNNVMITMGCDFQFENALQNFQNLDDLIRFVRLNHGDEVNIFYSTPETYVDYLHQTAHKFTVKIDDFLPYADFRNAYWSGYYTSRVAQKNYIGELGRFYEAAQTAASMDIGQYLGPAGPQSAQLLTKFYEYTTKLDVLTRALALNTHHDAVSGTEKQHVADDYVERMYDGKVSADTVIDAILKERAERVFSDDLTYSQCNMNRTSTECDPALSLESHNSVVITALNPGRAATTVVRSKVKHGSVKVINEKNEDVNAQVICENTAIIDTETENDIVQDCNLYFIDAFRDLETKNYRVVLSGTDINTVSGPSPGSRHQITNDEYTMTFNTLTGSFEDLVHCYEGASDNTRCLMTPFHVDFGFYRSNQASAQNSGAYIFRPDEETKEMNMPYRGHVLSVDVYHGEIVEQVTVEYETVKVKARLFRGANFPLEVETLIKPIDVSDKQGKEIVVKYSASINNNKTFYTDSCGLEMQERVVDFRPTWDLDVHQPIAGNYYPIRSAIYIEEHRKRLTVVNQRSQGASSYEEGKIEVMVHRRLLWDDLRGVGEPLNEEAYGRGLQTIFTHYVILNHGDSNDQRTLQRHLDQPLQVFYASSEQQKFAHFEESYFNLISSCIGDLPYRVKATLQLMDHATYGRGFLIKLVNLSEDHVAIDLKLADAKYLSLSANQEFREMLDNRKLWLTDEIVPHMAADMDTSAIDAVRMRPLEIRQYFIDFATIIGDHE